jgi:hypothetical protein
MRNLADRIYHKEHEMREKHFRPGNFLQACRYLFTPREKGIFGHLAGEVAKIFCALHEEVEAAFE